MIKHLILITLFTALLTACGMVGSERHNDHNDDQRDRRDDDRDDDDK